MVRIKALEEIPEVSYDDEIAISDTSLNQDKKVTVTDLLAKGNFVEEDTPFYLNGLGGDAYVLKSSVSGLIEFWRAGKKRFSF